MCETLENQTGKHRPKRQSSRKSTNGGTKETSLPKKETTSSQPNIVSIFCKKRTLAKPCQFEMQKRPRYNPMTLEERITQSQKGCPRSEKNKRPAENCGRAGRQPIPVASLGPVLKKENPTIQRAVGPSAYADQEYNQCPCFASSFHDLFPAK